MSIFKDLNETTIHFSGFLHIPIFSHEGHHIGKVSDVFVDYGEPYPGVLALQYLNAGHAFYITWNDIESFSLKKINLKDEAYLRRGSTYPKVMASTNLFDGLIDSSHGPQVIDLPPIGKVILDRQIVDTYGKKVVRVNDVQFIKVGRHLRVTHAEVGFTSMLRRLGYIALIKKITAMIGFQHRFPQRDTGINWKFVHAVPVRGLMNLQLNLTNEELKKLHPADLADILEELDAHGREAVFSSLDPETQAKTLSEVDEEFQTDLLESTEPEDAAKIIENMGTDEAADILSELPENQASEIISKIEDDEIQMDIQNLLEYDEDTAGGLMTTEVFQVPASTTRDDILKLIQEGHEEIDSIYDIYVVDDNEKLLGLSTLHNILIHKENLPISEIMNKSDIKSLSPTTQWREMAEFISKYNLINVPIVDTNGKLLGTVSVDDILPWLLGERT
jgi:CBS domain-containing protein